MVPLERVGQAFGLYRTFVKKKILSNLRSTFDDFLIESSTNGIKISYEDSVGLEVIYHHFFKESQAFALIEYLFFNKDVSNEYIAESLI